MGIGDIFALLGGLALFLHGMQMMSTGLETAAGNKMKEILEKLTSNRIKGVVVGAIITAVIQSSSATTVMVVGFVNSGLMTLNQAVWVIMGANIGTTITGQLIALDIGLIAPLIAFIGVAIVMFSKNMKMRHIASIFAGLGVLFIGMDMMSSSMSPLRDSEMFINFMSTVSNPLIGIIIGAVFTAIIQSSSASVGILQALAATGAIPLSTAVFILFGQNIGTCITAVLAAIGTKTNAKRATVIHLMFNVFGSILFTIVCIVSPFEQLVASITPNDPVAQIANMHTIFNIVTTLILLPFGIYMAKFACMILPDNDEEETEVLRLKYLRPFESNYVVGHTALVVSQIENEVNRMMKFVKRNIEAGFNFVLAQNGEGMDKIQANEEYVDYLNAEIAKYIVKMMSTEMSPMDSRRINQYYLIIGNLERIGDHATNIAEYSENLIKKGHAFSGHALAEIQNMKDICLRALEAITPGSDKDTAAMITQAAKYEQEIDDMKDRYLADQVDRMKQGQCKAETSLLYSEMLTDFERIGDHALNIAQEYHAMM